MEKKYPYKIDLAVLILFFCRPTQFEQVFEAVRKARPSRLYLYQDGPRNNREDDINGILECRKIAENIDWECEVHRLYQEKNYGCDPSEYMAQKWFFGQEEMGIVLEDDDVPAQSFFPFCKELLEKYKDDQRINMICGMNNLESAEWCPYSYLFTSGGTIWGWASWRRVIDEWEEKIPHLNDNYYVTTFKKRYDNAQTYLDLYQKNNESGIAHYEAILGANAWANNRLNIVPQQNLMSSVGISENSTHSVSNIKTVPKAIRRLYTMKRYEMDMPLQHPPFIFEDREYVERVNRMMGIGHPFIRFVRRIESCILRIRYGDISWLTKRKKKRNKTDGEK